MATAKFDWDPKKDEQNQSKHGVGFTEAKRVIAEDQSHSSVEKRHYCFGVVGEGVITVRFTYRDDVIRILGAGYWRKGKRIYERENQIHERAPGKTEGRS